jgi:HK97 family phage major capsid protein
MEYSDSLVRSEEAQELMLRAGVGQAIRRDVAGTAKPAANTRAQAFQRMAREALADAGYQARDDSRENNSQEPLSAESAYRQFQAEINSARGAPPDTPLTDADHDLIREVVAETRAEYDAESVPEPVSAPPRLQPPRLQVRDRQPEGRSVDVGAPVSAHMSAMSGRSKPRVEYDKPLPRDASFADLFDIPDWQRGASLGKHLRGVLFRDWRNADLEREIAGYQERVMSEGTQTAGGALVPTVYSSQVIDMARVQTQVLNAGAQFVPMSAPTVILGKWTSDPVPAFRNEGAAVAQSDASVDKITFTARSLAGYTTLSRELLEDTDLGNLLETSYARAVAIAWDNAALMGTGVAPIPLGLFNDTGITDKSALGANGVAFNYDHLIAAVGGVRGRNESVTAAVMAPRSYQSLGTLKDTTTRYITKPDYLADIPLLQTGQIPVNQTVGTANNCSTLFVGDFRQLFIGIRTSFGVDIYEQPAATTGQLLMLAWMRMDVQSGRKTAFAIRTGLLP